MDLLLTGAEVSGRAGSCVRVRGGRVAEVGAGLRILPGDEVLDVAGGAVLPGLHDHHVHLRAAAAARLSVDVTDATPARFDALVRAAAGAGPVRVVGWHEHASGDVDTARLDRLAPGKAVRVQHASGARWVHSSAGPASTAHDDDALLVALAAVAREAVAAGVTGITDATPGRDPSDIESLAAAASAGVIPQRLRLMAPPGVSAPPGATVSIGEHKLVLHDATLPPVGELAATVAASHLAGRAVAIHCVTADQLVVATAALEVAGGRRGDRIEHAGVVPPGYASVLRRLSLAVVTQPGFVVDRGDRYRATVTSGEQPWLYPCASLIAAGVPVAAGTDAPYGSLDPWRHVRAATERRTRAGHALGTAERVGPRRALALFLADPADLSRTRQVIAGAPADLCVLDAPLTDVLGDPGPHHVRGTLIAGRPVHWRP
jgi:predicted amidohydrolase YtcJ